MGVFILQYRFEGRKNNLAGRMKAMLSLAAFHFGSEWRDCPSIVQFTLSGFKRFEDCCGGSNGSNVASNCRVGASENDQRVFTR
jgi:hypothetical protein